MTETFAAAVAGVGPLIILAGVLEMRTYERMLHRALEAPTVLIDVVNDTAKLFRKADSAKDIDEILELVREAERIAARASGIKGRAGLRKGIDEALAVLGPGIAWIVAILALVAAETCSLGALGGIRFFQGPYAAVLSFLAIIISMLIVIASPLISIVLSIARPTWKAGVAENRVMLTSLRFSRRTKGREREELSALAVRSAPLLEPFLPLLEELLPGNSQAVQQLTEAVRNASKRQQEPLSAANSALQQADESTDTEQAS